MCKLRKPISKLTHFVCFTECVKITGKDFLFPHSIAFYYTTYCFIREYFSYPKLFYIHQKLIRINLTLTFFFIDNCLIFSLIIIFLQVIPSLHMSYCHIPYATKKTNWSLGGVSFSCCLSAYTKDCFFLRFHATSVPFL